MRSAGDVGTVAVVGAGAIGASWSSFVLGLGLDVVLVDPSPQALEAVQARLRSQHPAAMESVQMTSDAGHAAEAADLVLEAAPERLELKRSLFAELDAAAAPDVILASSTSALTATAIQHECRRHPERVVVAHPFNPPHVMPLVEVVGGEQTSEEAVVATMATMVHWGKRPVRLRQELPGHIANRLQAALWREAYDLVSKGAVSAAELDAVVAAGPGLRWALLGPFATQHLSGGPGGFAHLMEHLGPPTEAMWRQLGDPALTPDVTSALVASVEEEFEGVDVLDLERRRDAALNALMDLKHEHDLDAPRGRSQQGADENHA